MEGRFGALFLRLQSGQSDAMAKKDTYQPLEVVTFACPACRVGRRAKVFKATPSRVEDMPDDEVHPWRYFGACECGAECEQAPHERGLIRAWRRATGPRTEAGKAASARNLEGHPTAEEALRTRFNGMKHGLSAKTATYFPAKPDGYTFCKACEIDREYCRAQPACEKQTKLFMLHRAAFEQRNPKVLMGVYADFHSALLATIQQVLQTIIAEGVTVRSPKTYVDKDGRCLVVEYYDEQGNRCVVNDVEAHPLFRPLGELISRTGISLAELGMSGKNAEQEVALPGQLQGSGKGVEAIEDFARKQSAALEALGGLVMRAKEKTREDPVLIEFKEQIGGAGS